MKTREINAKWRTFAEKVASGQNATEAYIEAGYKADNRRSVHSAAARLRAEPRVREYITELRQTADQISCEDTAFTLAAKLTLLARIAQTSAATVAENDEIIQYHRTFKDGGSATRLPCKLRAIKLHSELVGHYVKPSAPSLTRDALRDFLHELRLTLQAAAPTETAVPETMAFFSPRPPDEPENIEVTQQKLTKPESPEPIEPTAPPAPPELTPAALRRAQRPAYGSFAPEPRPLPRRPSRHATTPPWRHRHPLMKRPSELPDAPEAVKTERFMAAPLKNIRWFSTILWGNSIALSWMWGLGLFFSVQFTTQFGLIGLLTFALTNMVGLLVFGLVTHHIARREPGSESLARFFATWSRPFRLVFFLYQFLAITLTMFAFIRYGWQPLGFEPWTLYMPLTLLIMLAAAILFGEEFDIKRIKYSHGVLGLILAAAVAWLIITAARVGPGRVTFPRLPTDDWNYWGYAVPIIIGFLVGPWLDLQQWQRAIQMHRERVSIAAGYWIGSIQFFLLLLFHGLLTLWALNHGAGVHIRSGIGGYHYGQDTLIRLFFQAGSPWTFGAYAVWIIVCILTTLDSGYVALRWFLQDNAARSINPLFALIPKRLVTSPIPIFICCGLVALVAAVIGLELEYFMIFYATFFVGYSALSIARCYLITPANAIPQVKMFCIGSVAVVIFAFGYFLRAPMCQIIGSLLPLGYIGWLLLKPGSNQEFVLGSDELDAPAQDIAPIAGGLVPIHPTDLGGDTALAPAPVVHQLGGHFEGKWFVHSFVATYADTNSVGNVYFGMYAMWVGKTRELFFNCVMPKFDLKSTPFYILTRSFEHKFVRETREFETVSVRIRIESYNRKFVTLQHEIFDSAANILGRGKQTLLFVSSTDYKLIDMPGEVSTAFMVYT